MTRTFVVGLLALLVAGCGTNRNLVTFEGREVGAKGLEPVPGLGLLADGQQANQTRAGHCASRVCVIEVSVVGNDCTKPDAVKVDPPTLKIGREREDHRIVWRFADPVKHRFCQSQGDGVFIQPFQDRQFLGVGVTDSPVGDEQNIPEKDCARFARVMNWNDDTRRYTYFLQFSDTTVKDKDGNFRTCKTDPWIKNGR